MPKPDESAARDAIAWVTAGDGDLEAMVAYLADTYTLDDLIGAQKRLLMALMRLGTDDVLEQAVPLLARAIQRVEDQEEPEPLPADWKPPVLKVVK